MFMLAFESFKTLNFDEHNIIKFFKLFKKQCDEYEIIEKNVKSNSFAIVCDSLRTL